jgi:hypothetical protein
MKIERVMVRKKANGYEIEWEAALSDKDSPEEVTEQLAERLERVKHDSEDDGK